MNSAVPLSAWQVAAAGALVLIGAAISLALRLGLERRLLVASARMVVQLSLLGVVLGAIFEPPHRWYVVVALMAFMTLVAGTAAVRRAGHRYPGIWLDAILSVWASSWIVATVGLEAIVQIDPWYAPRYAIPILGMILGNTLNGISIGLDRLSGELRERRVEVETRLALGATSWEAARPAIRAALRTGMIPIINSMMVAGLVNLPGMMTGQLLGGERPQDAVLYQIVIIFFIAAATSLGCVSVVLLGYRRLFNADHQFLAERIREVGR